MEKRVVKEIFVDSPICDEQGRFLPAPYVAQLMFESWRKNWQPEGLEPDERAMVSMGPRVVDGVEGYSVRCEIVKKGSPERL